MASTKANTKWVKTHNERGFLKKIFLFNFKKTILIKTAGKWEISFLVNQQEFTWLRL